MKYLTNNTHLICEEDERYELIDDYHEVVSYMVCVDLFDSLRELRRVYSAESGYKIHPGSYCDYILEDTEEVEALSSIIVLVIGSSHFLSYIQNTKYFVYCFK